MLYFIIMAQSRLNLSIENKENLLLIAKALSSEIRINILRMLKNYSMSISELAEALSQPVSSTALNVRILENAALVSTKIIYTQKGRTRLCRRTYDNLEISTVADDICGDGHPHEIVKKIKVSSFSAYEDITAPCGMVSTANYIGPVDDTDIFFSPDRIKAQLIWFTSGALEWRITKHSVAMPLKEMLISFEACSEAPCHRNDHKSDITMWINDVEVGTWTSPGDFGERRGQLNPPFWPLNNTQYGIWTSWRIDNKGTFFNGRQISSVTMQQLNISSHPYISLKIGVKKDAKNVGGINLFGEKMGDYPQDIIVKLRS